MQANSTLLCFFEAIFFSNTLEKLVVSFSLQPLLLYLNFLISHQSGSKAAAGTVAEFKIKMKIILTFLLTLVSVASARPLEMQTSMQGRTSVASVFATTITSATELEFYKPLM